MPKGRISKILEGYGYWRLAQVATTAAFVVLTSLFVLALVVPVRLDSDPAALLPGASVVSAHGVPEVLQMKTPDLRELARVVRPGLFKAETPLGDRPRADSTVKRIMSQLTLVCVMEMRGEPVAYVDIKGGDMKQCKVGQSVGDLFTVVSIDVETQSVEVTIVGHKVRLSR